MYDIVSIIMATLAKVWPVTRSQYLTLTMDGLLRLHWPQSPTRHKSEDTNIQHEGGNKILLILSRGLSFNYKIRKSRSESKLIFNMSNKFYWIQKWYPSLILHLSFFKLRFCSWIFCHESKTKWPVFQVLLRITWQLLNFYLHHLLAKVDIQ